MYGWMDVWMYSVMCLPICPFICIIPYIDAHTQLSDALHVSRRELGAAAAANELQLVKMLVDRGISPMAINTADEVVIAIHS